ncbi:MAG: hypothetical protein CME19_21945 [Gemmatimonadetes bacterium]|nr:hypothetical protein [Gemmatimonadota bacterium]
MRPSFTAMSWYCQTRSQTVDSHPSIFVWIAVLGGVYLSKLGIRSLRHSHVPVSRRSEPYARGLLTSLTNPRAFLFFIALFTTISPPSYRRP